MIVLAELTHAFEANSSVKRAWVVMVASNKLTFAEQYPEHPREVRGRITMHTAECDSGKRSAGLRTLLNDLDLEEFGIGTGCWLHEIPA